MLKPPPVARRTIRRRVISTNMRANSSHEVSAAGAPGWSPRGPLAPFGRRKELGKGFVELVLGLFLGDPDGEGQLGHEDLAGLGQHALLARRQALVLVPDRQVPDDLRNLVDVARLQLL